MSRWGSGRRPPTYAPAVLGPARGKGMVLDEDDHDTWSAGSFFTNPILDADAAAALPAGAPRFPQPDGRVKTSAAWLIDAAGFGKGYGRAPARLSSKHTLALTNRGSATGERPAGAGPGDPSRRTRRAFGITLVPEPILVGCEL